MAVTLMNNFISRKCLFSFHLKGKKKIIFWAKRTFQKFSKFSDKSIFSKGFLCLFSTPLIAPMKNATHPIHLPRHFLIRFTLPSSPLLTSARTENYFKLL